VAHASRCTLDLGLVRELRHLAIHILLVWGCCMTNPEARENQRKYMREYYHRPEVKARQKERMRIYHKDYYQRPEIKKHRESYHRVYQKEYYQRPEIKKRTQEYMKDYNKGYNQRPDIKKRKNRQRREQHKILQRQFLEMYGGVCMCCGEKDIRFLTLDHVNGNGSADRRERSRAAILREALSDLNTEKYQILCYNCNMGKAINDGVCPHHNNSSLTKPSIRHTHSKNTRQRRNLRTRLFEVYGPVCACCGESEERFLTLDHKLNDGNDARKQSGAFKIMRKAISEADPRKYQVLCFNCNCARSQHNGICPHDVK